MEQFHILWVAKSYALPQSGVKAHTHPYYHMLYVDSGVCSMVANGRHYTLTPGQCILIPPNTEHSYSNRQSVEMDYQEIKFTTSKTLSLQISDSQLVANLFEQVVREYTLLGRLADKAAGVYMAAILTAITEKERLARTGNFQYVDASTFGELAQSVVHYLESHYQDVLRLDEIATAVGHNKSYLCVAFKKDTGFTILDCLNTIRVRRAAELIVYSDHGFAQVADMCGFTSVSHFNRVFLKYVGITPGQCRRAYPADIMLGYLEESENRPSRFMYSVLAHKTITPQMVRHLDQLEKNSEE